MDLARMPATAEKPHGLNDTLTIHQRNGERLVGFDNAHPIRGQAGPGGRKTARDHRHRLKTVRPYEYRDAAALLGDIWTEVIAVCREVRVET